MKKERDRELEKLWKTFSETGQIGAYMTYRAVQKRLKADEETHS